METPFLFEQIHPQPMFAVLQDAARLEREGVEINHLEIGDFTGFRNEVFEEHLIGAASNPSSYRYSPSAGRFDTQCVVAEVNSDIYGPLAPENVVIAPANYLLVASVLCFAKRGGRVWVPDPGFPTYRLACEFASVEVATYEPGQDGCLCGSVEPGDLIIVNSPSNPLGVAISEGLRTCLDRHIGPRDGVLQIWDDTYILVQEPGRVDERPALLDAGRSTGRLIVRSLSKEGAVPGVRAGYMLGPTAEISRVSDFLSLSISCAPSYVQVAMEGYLADERSRNFTETLCSEMSRRRSLLREFDGISANLAWVPESTLYAVVRVDDEDACFHDLLHEYRVCVCPGSAFAMTKHSPVQENLIRISLGGTSEDVESGLREIDRYLLTMNGV